jgi:hypothetical protein
MRGLDPRIHLSKEGWIAGSRLRRGFDGLPVSRAAEALAKGGKPGNDNSGDNSRNTEG